MLEESEELLGFLGGKLLLEVGGAFSVHEGEVGGELVHGELVGGGSGDLMVGALEAILSYLQIVSLEELIVFRML